MNEYTGREIVLWVAGHYSKEMAESVSAALADERSPVFARHVRRSFTREMQEHGVEPETADGRPVYR